MSATDIKVKLDEVNGQIEQVKTQAQEAWTAFEQKRDEFAKAGNEANRTDSDEFKAAEAVHKRYAEKASELSELEKVRDGIFRMASLSGHAVPTSDQPGERKDDPEAAERKSLGERAADSPEYKRLIESGALSSDRASFAAKLADMDVAEVKTLITGLSDTSGGAFITNDRKPYVQQPRRPVSVLDLITIGETGVDAVEYARQTTFTNVAAETAEATATTTGTKPEATIAFEKVTETVKTIAHWVPATRRSLADVPQMQTLIDSQLRYGLQYRLESQIVAGGGTGEDLKGLLNQSNILTQAKSTDSVADAIHKAITQIRLGFVEPNGVGIHPTDWELLRLARDDGGYTAGTGAYLYGPPSADVQPTIWGLPVAVSAAFSDDTAVVADFRQATLWLREGATVLATDSHSDFFVKNLVAILAEMRAAFGLLLPQAVCKVTGLD
jgi:HK97 family phage major capsid protein